ncbi:MAG: 6-bladed beta-propeller [Gemmatimonadota bacterium]
MLKRCFAVVVLGFTAACSVEEPPTPAANEVRDSAGVQILIAAAPSFDTVHLATSLEIGGEGDPDYEFFRVQQISPLASGNIVVTNGGTHELLFYDAVGSFIRRVGRRGEGPGEFGFLSTVYPWAGDSLITSDPRNRRISVFDSAGVFGRDANFSTALTDVAPETTCAFPGLNGVLGDGAWFTRGWGCMEFNGADGPKDATVTMEIVHEERNDTIGTFTSNRVWEHGDADPGPGMWSMIRFDAVMRTATTSDHVYLSLGTSHDVFVYDGSGALVTILRERAELDPVSNADIEAYRAARLAEGDTVDADQPFAEHFAGYDRLIISHEGELWAKWTERPTEEGRRWTVWSADRTERRNYLLPDLDIRAMRGGKLYALTRDDLGLQQVVVLDWPAS